MNDDTLTSEELRLVTALVPLSLRSAMHVALYRNGTNFTAWVREAMEEYIAMSEAAVRR